MDGFVFGWMIYICLVASIILREGQDLADKLMLFAIVSAGAFIVRKIYQAINQEEVG